MALSRRGVSVAAVTWQRALIAGLSLHVEGIDVVSTLPTPVWPRGPLIGGVRPGGSEGSVPARQVRYLNIAGLRGFAMGVGAIRALPNNASVAVTYNIARSTAIFGRRAQREGMAWIAIVADVPVRGRARQQHDAWLASSDAQVLLSWGSYERWRSPRKLHLDGGVLPAYPASCETDPAVMFAGSLELHNGLDLLVEAFRSVPSADAQLWICGKGDPGPVRALASDDQRIHVFPNLPGSDLVGKGIRARAFVSPRPPEMNADNFPSKVLEYLRYRKPIVSTWTAGMAPEYRDVLIVPASSSAADFGAAICEALSTEADERASMAQRIEAFSLCRSWDVQGGRLAAFAEQLDCGRPR